MFPPLGYVVGLSALMLMASVSSSTLIYKASCTEAAGVTTKATGLASISLLNSSYATGFFYATGINQMTAAHLHAGVVGKAGPPIAWAFNATYGPVSGSVKASFTFNPSVNKLKISSLLKSGLIYFDIHTVAYPKGELRGQLASTTKSVKVTSTPPPLPDGSYKETCLSVDDVMCEMIGNPNGITTPGDPQDWLSCGACYFNNDGVIYSPQDLDLRTCSQPPYVVHDVNSLSLSCAPPFSSPPPPLVSSPPPPASTCLAQGDPCLHKGKMPDGGWPVCCPGYSCHTESDSCL